MLVLLAVFWIGVVAGAMAISFFIGADEPELFEHQREIETLRSELERKTNLLVACQIAKNKALRVAEGGGHDA